MSQIIIFILIGISSIGGSILSQSAADRAEESASGNTTDSVYVTTTPPVPRVEPKPPAPNRGAVWIAGHWQWTGDEFRWLTGHWVEEPQGLWVPGFWIERPQGFVWIPGRWVNQENEQWSAGHWQLHKGTRIWVADHPR